MEPIQETTNLQEPQESRDAAALERELTQLREENRRRDLLEEARAALEERGIDPRFGEFILGEDSGAIRRRAEQFDRQLSETLKRHLAAHLPAGEPRDPGARRPAVRRPGIRRVRR